MEQQKGCTGFTLKMIAVITMLIDHIGATIVERSLVQMPAGGFITWDNYDTWRMIYIAMRGIGRMAFPIYCFLLVEGFTYTRSKLKYAIRLAIFAVVSEIPFDLAFQKSIWDNSYNNVFLTLAIGLIVLCGVHFVQQKFQNMESLNVGMRFLQFFIMIIIVFAGMAVADFLNTDYGAAGVATIVVMYVLHNQKMLGFAAGVLTVTLMSSVLEALAFFMLIPIYFYNGKRGHQMKYFFYLFYPVHLLILAFICYFMGLGI